MSQERFIKFIPGEKADWLQENYPMAFLLLCLIARRARRESGHLDGLEIGDAILGDFEKAGLTRKQYRTALDNLVELDLIEILIKSKNSKKCQKRAIKRAIKGTLVNLKDTGIWDINANYEGHQVGQQGAIKGPSKGHKEERRRMKKNEKKKDSSGLFPNRDEKLSILAPFAFAEIDLETLLNFPLQQIIEAVEAYKQYSSLNAVKSPRTWLDKAIQEGWKPNLSKQELQKAKDQMEEEKETRVQQNILKARKIVEEWKEKFIFRKFEIIISDSIATVTYPTGYCPINLAEDNCFEQINAYLESQNPSNSNRNTSKIEYLEQAMSR